jgi:hypothetical protein
MRYYNHVTSEELLKIVELIKVQIDIIDRREIMESDCLNFQELANKHLTHIFNILSNLKEDNELT